MWLSLIRAATVAVTGDFENSNAVRKVLGYHQAKEALKTAKVAQLSHHGACTRTTSNEDLCGKANRIEWLKALSNVYVADVPCCRARFGIECSHCARTSEYHIISSSAPTTTLSKQGQPYCAVFAQLHKSGFRNGARNPVQCSVPASHSQQSTQAAGRVAVSTNFPNVFQTTTVDQVDYTMEFSDLVGVV